MKQNKVANVANKFYCEKCDYNTGRKSNYNKHLMTLKHQGKCIPETYETKAVANVANNFQCICGNVFNSRTTLWRHKNICNNTTNNIFTPKMFYDLLQQNNELTKQVIELSSKPTTTNKLILNSFLNETCKDAINLYDFVKQLQIGDIEHDEIDRIGYVDGISKIFINGLDQLNINQRPVHCRDTKRETVYIKHENQWEKENFANVKLTNAIGHIVKMLQNVWKRRLILKEQASKSYSFPTTLIDVSEVTNAPRIDGTTIQQSNTYYKRISRNIMKESIIEN